MAQRQYFNGSVGPLAYDDENTYEDGVTHRAFRGLANLEIGSLPTTPEDGDLWTIGGNVRVRLLGTVYDLLTGGGTGISVGDTLTGDVTGTLASPSTTTTISPSVLSSFGRTLIDDANAAAALATLGLDADLATFSLPGSTTISAFGASLIDDAAASNARTTLGLGTIATQNANAVAITGGAVDGTTVGATTKASGGFTTITNGSAAATSSTNFLTDNMVAGNVWTNSAWVGFKYTGLASTEYAIMQSSGGATVINCKTGTDIKFLINNVQQAAMTSSGNWNLASGKVYQINGTQIGLSTGLAGVLVSTPSAGHMLLYDDSDSRFENVAMSGDATITKAGVITVAATVSGHKTLYTEEVAVDTPGTGESDLMTYTIAAGKLATDEDSILFEMAFSVLSSATNERVRIYYDGTVIYDSGAAKPPVDRYLIITGRIVRRGATSQLVMIRIESSGTYGTTPVITTTSKTLANALVLKATGDVSAGLGYGIVRQEWMKVAYEPGV